MSATPYADAWSAIEAAAASGAAPSGAVDVEEELATALASRATLTPRDDAHDVQDE